MSDHHTDVLVLGGGTMGTAAGWAVAKRGQSVRVIEQFDHVHLLGSHGGITRIFRHAYAEGADYVPWAIEADRQWVALQQRAGTPFSNRVGCLDMATSGYDHARLARSSADTHGLSYEWLTGREVRERFPAWKVPDDVEACYTTDSGYLLVEPALKALASEMLDAGGVLETQCTVESWSVDGAGVRLVTSNGAFTADRLIVTAGAWNVHLLQSLGMPLEVRRKPVFWFEADDPSSIEPNVMPCWILECEFGHPYGLPQVDVPGLKSGMHSDGDPADPNTIDRTIHERDVEESIGPFLRKYLNGISGKVLSSAVCMYSMTPDEDFIIDRHPEHEAVVFAAGFSGHGFKFAPVIGSHLADLALDAAALPRPLFSMQRFASVS